MVFNAAFGTPYSSIVLAFVWNLADGGLDRLDESMFSIVAHVWLPIERPLGAYALKTS
jgi:hypothetical protein